jgi:Integrase core domain
VQPGPSSLFGVLAERRSTARSSRGRLFRRSTRPSFHDVFRLPLTHRRPRSFLRPSAQTLLAPPADKRADRATRPIDQRRDGGSHHGGRRAGGQDPWRAACGDGLVERRGDVDGAKWREVNSLPLCVPRAHRRRHLHPRVPRHPRRLLAESFNGKLRDECLNLSWFASVDEARQLIEAWMDRRAVHARATCEAGGINPLPILPTSSRACRISPSAGSTSCCPVRGRAGRPPRVDGCVGATWTSRLARRWTCRCRSHVDGLSRD